MADKLEHQVSRRRFVAGTAATGAGLFGLVTVGCSSSNNNSNKNSAATTAATKAATTAATTAATSAATTVATAAGSPAATRAASPTAAAAATGSPAAASTLKITGDIQMGFISSFTGPLAPVYAPFVNGSKLAIAEINEKGGIGGAQVKLAQADDQGNPANVPAAALGLVDQKIKFCCGPIGSNAISASPALNQGKIIQCGYSDNPALTDVSKFPFSFRFVWSAEQSSKLIVDYLTKQLSIDKIAILGENTVYGQTDLPTTEKYMQSVNLKPVLSEYFAPGTADFTALLRKVQDAGAKAIVWWTQGGPEGTSVVKNMEDLKIDMPIVGIGLIAGALKGAVPPARLDKVWSVAWKNSTYTDAAKVPQNYQDFVQRLDKAGFHDPGGSAATAPFYDFVYYIKAGIEATGGTDSTAIVQYMEKTPYAGIVANYNGITAKDHSTVKDDQITLSVLGSWDPSTRPFAKRVPGL